MYSIDAIVNQYLYKKLSYRNVMALGLGIVDLIFFYMLSPTELSMAICLLLLIFSNVIALYAIYKKMGVLITGHFSYFILYLCALEIAPYIILYFILIGS